MGYIDNYILKHPKLKINLRRAGLNISPEVFVKQAINQGIIFAFLLFLTTFLLHLKLSLIPNVSKSLIYAFIAGLLGYFIGFRLKMASLNSRIKKRGKEMDAEALYAGRFLLVKLNAGKPIVNTILEASKAKYVGEQYFKEVVKNIELGTPVEVALENASRFSPSSYFKKLFFQLSTALRVGVDVSRFLEATVKEIQASIKLEITRYSKKLNSMILFFMLFAVVFPSLGTSLIVLISSLMGFVVDSNFFIILFFAIIVVQITFILLVKAIKPSFYG